MNKPLLSSFVLAALILSAGCTQKNGVEVDIANNLDLDRKGEMVELNAHQIIERLGSENYYVVDAEGNEIPSQTTHDGLIIFQADVAANSSSTYTILPSDTLHTYPTVVTGRIYPERADDVAWENELVGFRAYGPATQAKGERAFGYDIFFKHATEEPILETLYAAETSPRTWEIVDSLRKIDNQLAEDYISTFSYHIDHGLGMDCYAVGPTLGAGVAALAPGDSLNIPWCYSKAEVLDNGPLRFTLSLDFATRGVGIDSISESRIITLDAGSQLNKASVTYNGFEDTETCRVAFGFPRRDESAALNDSTGIIAYADPTQGPDNGKAMLGIVKPSGFDYFAESEGHILGFDNVATDAPIEYFWGFAWDREDIKSFDEWTKYLSDYAKKLENPLTVTVR